MLKKIIQTLKDKLNSKTDFTIQLKQTDLLISRYTLLLNSDDGNTFRILYNYELDESLYCSFLNIYSGNNTKNIQLIPMNENRFITTDVYNVFTDMQGLSYISFPDIPADHFIEPYIRSYAKCCIERLQAFKKWLLDRHKIKPPSVIFNK